MTKAEREIMRKMGRKGGRATAKRMSAEQRSAAARKAAQARWSARKLLQGNAQQI